MAVDEHVAVVKSGWEAVRRWREQNPRTRLDLSGAHLLHTDLTGEILDDANLRDAELVGANATEASLRGVDLRHATLDHADLSEVDLSRRSAPLESPWYGHAAHMFGWCGPHRAPDWALDRTFELHGASVARSSPLALTVPSRYRVGEPVFIAGEVVDIIRPDFSQVLINFSDTATILTSWKSTGASTKPVGSERT